MHPRKPFFPRPPKPTSSPNTNVHRFDESLARGKRAEARLLAALPGAVPSQDLRWDLEWRDLKLDVKADANALKFDSFFAEVEHHGGYNKPGWLHTAPESIDYLVLLADRGDGTGVSYFVRPSLLKDWVTACESFLKRRSSRNPNYVSEGLIVDVGIVHELADAIGELTADGIEWWMVDSSTELGRYALELVPAVLGRDA